LKAASSAIPSPIWWFKRALRAHLEEVRLVYEKRMNSRGTCAFTDSRHGRLAHFGSPPLNTAIQSTTADQNITANLPGRLVERAIVRDV
jgi:hypothetical protein